MEYLGLTDDQQFYLQKKLDELFLKQDDYEGLVAGFMIANQGLKDSVSDEIFVSAMVTHVYKEFMEDKHKNTEDPLSVEQRLDCDKMCLSQGVPHKDLWVIGYVAKNNRRLKEKMTDSDFVSIIVAKVRGASNALKCPPSPLPREVFNRPIHVKTYTDE